MTRTPGHIKGKVTVVPLDAEMHAFQGTEMRKRASTQRGATETCFLHVALGRGGASKDKADDCRGSTKVVMR